MSENAYDKTDMVRRLQVLYAGPLKAAVYQVKDPETGEFGQRQYHITFDNTVIAVMGESVLDLLVTLRRQLDEPVQETLPT